MKKLLSVLKEENIGSGYIYAYVHFAVEVVCFYMLGQYYGDSAILWLVPFIYDALAFAPQAIFGYLSDKFSKIPMGLIGCGFLVASIALFYLNIGLIPSLICLCIGNGLIHVNGAEVTLRAAKGKLSHSAIFVGGGSFGVVTGKLIAKIVPRGFVYGLIFTMIPFILLGETYREEADKEKTPCIKFNYNNPKVNMGLIVLLSTLVVIVRGYMGYGIPTTWNKTTIQTIALFSIMGIGKALGGILADTIGVKKLSIISSLGALPFLLFGDNYMYISLIGVLMFSMTMSITLALLTSVLPDAPGLAFGFTTIGLFLGTAPIFFFKFPDVLSNCINISVLTLCCVFILCKIIRKDEV